MSYEDESFSNNDDELAPMVDGLSGALAAIILISVFLMLSTIGGGSDGVKNYGEQKLKEAMTKNDVMKRELATVELAKNQISFTTSFTLDEDTKELINKDIGDKGFSISVYSNEDDEISVFNSLYFIELLGIEGQVIDILFFDNQESLLETKIIWSY
ncbi:hypothetical protein [Vibrio coralliilyticus]|uniref:hypothetical protein n=1 Tax=Vibrio coralliilyticus TaxID=190893 RepID=UPI00183F4C10|nr:hypothetical protein [Vibrio coralliilyticus]NUW70134.1 hypothetical protein [Vibrio coralliilyticus]